MSKNLSRITHSIKYSIKHLVINRRVSLWIGHRFRLVLWRLVLMMQKFIRMLRRMLWALILLGNLSLMHIIQIQWRIFSGRLLRHLLLPHVLLMELYRYVIQDREIDRNHRY